MFFFVVFCLTAFNVFFLLLFLFFLFCFMDMDWEAFLNFLFVLATRVAKCHASLVRSCFPIYSSVPDFGCSFGSPCIGFPCIGCLVCTDSPLSNGLGPACSSSHSNRNSPPRRGGPQYTAAVHCGCHTAPLRFLVLADFGFWDLTLCCFRSFPLFLGEVVLHLSHCLAVAHLVVSRIWSEIPWTQPESAWGLVKYIDFYISMSLWPVVMICHSLK